ncbi:hypothetical protein F4781DRAFT_433285 [Annulohypoxylon bovei var. microspora]|nr:hypothetical protein F4781DRAFT_433285 [Annulohypoxylon bovei var. microspora]
MSKAAGSDSDERAGKGKGKAPTAPTAPTDVTSLAGVRKNYDNTVNQAYQRLEPFAEHNKMLDNMNKNFDQVFTMITTLTRSIATGKSINQPDPSPAKTNLSPSEPGTAAPELGTAAPELGTAAPTDTANQPPAEYATEYAECTREPTEEEEAATQKQLAIQHEALMARSYHKAQEGWCSQASTTATAATCSRRTWTTVTPYGYDDHG